MRDVAFGLLAIAAGMLFCFSGFVAFRIVIPPMGNEFIAAVTAQKNVLSLEEAQRRLAQLNEDVKSRASNNQASMAVASLFRVRYSAVSHR